MNDVLIIGDNNFMQGGSGIGRASGGHRIATHLRRHGYKVEVIDFATHWSIEEWDRALDLFVGTETIFLGIAANLLTYDEKLDPLTDRWRERFPDKPIVIGGNNLLSRTCRNIDYYIEGYAEELILDFIKYLQGKIPKDHIKWSSFKTDKNFIACNEDYKNVDTSDLTISYLPTDYIEPNESIALETARGCLFKCKFCTYPLIGKKKIDYLRDIQSLIDEIKFNHDTWGTTKYIISEDTFNDSLFKIQSLHDGLEKLPFDIEFMCYAKIELMIAYPEMLPLLRNMGLRGIHFGIETFNRKAGQLIGKGMEPQRIKEGLLHFRQEMPQVHITCSNIVGIPYQQDEECWEAREWYERSGVDHWSWQPLYLPNPKYTIHNSEFSRNALMYGLIEMSDQEIDECLDQEKKNLGSTVQRASFARDTVRKKLILWKNKFTGKNYFDASQQAIELNETSVTRKWSPWAIFEHTFTGISVDEMRTWGFHNVIPNVPKEMLYEKTLHFISRYKSRKIGNE